MAAKAAMELTLETAEAPATALMAAQPATAALVVLLPPASPMSSWV
jgi:hypothetical protein